jgi:hypothetical protein
MEALESMSSAEAMEAIAQLEAIDAIANSNSTATLPVSSTPLVDCSAVADMYPSDGKG